MRMLSIALLGLLALTALGMLYFRLAPVDPARWHQRPTGEPATTGPGDRVEIGGFHAVRQITAPGAEVLTALQTAALATARTQVLAGDIGSGMLTFQTRSAFWGFPDYTTARIEGDLLIIHGRLRFGRSDLGVNRARITGWLGALAPLTAPL